MDLAKLVVKLKRTYAPAFNHGMADIILQPDEVKFLIESVGGKVPTLRESYRLSEAYDQYGDER